MRVHGKDYRTVWMKGGRVYLIEQNRLPFEFRVVASRDYRQTCDAIRTMVVRGAGAIGAAAGFALAQAFLEAPARNPWPFVKRARTDIAKTRPTAQNLFYALQRVFDAAQAAHNPRTAALREAQALADEDAACSRSIGQHGTALIARRCTIATICNAGWLAFVDYGTALAPIYAAAAAGKKVFVYVHETRPRCQGARLTAWELGNAGIAHTIVPDHATAHLMAQGKIDLFIAGADRIAANGDTANKIGTCEKAIVARHYKVPFYIAAPTATIDPDCASGAHIPIEERSANEVLFQSGPDSAGRHRTIRTAAPGASAYNPAFDVTPARLITALITERGVVRPTRAALQRLLHSTPARAKR
jgi:methylthioribose-1-phosphate isomerase